ncbi:hypothetical protein [Lentzea aerocolonigenes]|uniref:hypothetical protein n=1 Tax=Lentzea aerocolonigenes TaxID=68170 RepID=UPI000A3D98B3|nr:hypothetical protein [Lentzea aerocolonigenes]
MSGDLTSGASSEMEAARQSLEELVGERWNAIGRAADLLWLGFGNRHEVVNHRGETREVSKYALHVQCPWRVRFDDQLVTGSSDIYRPGPDWIGEDDFDWDVQGVNLFDMRASELAERLTSEAVVVASVEVTTWGDLAISLSNGYQVEVLRTGSVREEDWRFFKPYSANDHVVVFEPVDS